MERKFNVADFAALVGTTSKTIYQKIDNYENLSVNEQLKTVKERVKGREITLVITTDDQINYYKNLYSKNIVNGGEYYENVTISNSQNPVNELQNPVKHNNINGVSGEVVDRLITHNETYLERIEKLINELSEYKSKQLLLEDKAGREGAYLQEINELRTNNEKLTNYNKWLFTLLVTIIAVLITVSATLFIVNNRSQNEDTKKEHASQEIVVKHAQK